MCRPYNPTANRFSRAGTLSIQRPVEAKRAERRIGWLPVVVTPVIAAWCLALNTMAIGAQRSSSSPRRGDTLTLEGIAFVAIPGGEFAMGDSSELAQPNERPVHHVTLDPFWMATTEVTFRQWKTFLSATGHPAGRSTASSDDHPVVGITWEDARAFCDWISKTHSVTVRLPSEAEWEYAARGGLEGRQYPKGNTISQRDANYATKEAVVVGRYPPNGYGLYDMAGNVFEWVRDWYDPTYYRASPTRNPRGPATNGDKPQRRADRGGGWCMGIERVRVAARHAGPGAWDEGGTSSCLGFRPLMDMSPDR